MQTELEKPQGRTQPDGTSEEGDQRLVLSSPDVTEAHVLQFPPVYLQRPRPFSFPPPPLPPRAVTFVSGQTGSGEHSAYSGSALITLEPLMHADDVDLPLRAGMEVRSARVLLWERGGSKDKPGGHLAMLIRDTTGFFYVDLNPETQPACWKYVWPCYSTAGERKPTYYVEGEQRNHAAWVIEIKGLDTAGMVKALGDIEGQGQEAAQADGSTHFKWRLWGDCCCVGVRPCSCSSLSRYQSCASVVYELLAIGGLFNRLYPSTDVKYGGGRCCPTPYYSPAFNRAMNFLKLLGYGVAVFGTQIIGSYLTHFIRYCIKCGHPQGYHPGDEDVAEAAMGAGVLVFLYLAWRGAGALWKMGTSRHGLVVTDYPFIENLIKLALDPHCTEVCFYKVGDMLSRTLIAAAPSRLLPPAVQPAEARAPTGDEEAGSALSGQEAAAGGRARSSSPRAESPSGVRRSVSHLRGSHSRGRLLEGGAGAGDYEAMQDTTKSSSSSQRLTFG
jgi:hypothetical protein